MAKRGSKRPPVLPSYPEDSVGFVVDSPPDVDSNNGTQKAQPMASTSRTGHGHWKPPIGLGAAALTWRDRIAALGVERRAREVSFLDASIAERTSSLRSVKAALAEAQSELGPLLTELQHLRTQRQSLCHEVQSLQSRQEALSRIPEEMLAAEAELALRREQIDAARRERELCEEQTAAAHAGLASVEQLRQTGAVECQDLTLQAAELRSQAAELERSIASYQSQAGQAREAFEAESCRVDQIKATRADAEARFAVLQDHLATAESAYRNLEEAERRRVEAKFEAHELREQMAQAERAIREATGELERLNQHIDRARAECAASDAERTGLCHQLEEVRAEAAAQEAALSCLNRQAEAARETLVTLGTQRGEIEAAIAELRANQSRMEEEACEQEAEGKARRQELTRMDEELLELHRSLQIAKLSAEAEAERSAAVRRECRQRIDEAEWQLHEVQTRRGIEESLVAQLSAQQEELQAGLTQLDEKIAQAHAELESLAQRKQEAEQDLAHIAGEREHHLAQRQLALDECAKVREQLTEAAARLVCLRELVDGRELDLAELQRLRSEEQARYDAERQTHRAEAAAADLQVRASCEALARLTAEVEVRRTEVLELRESVQQESVRLSSAQQELSLHLARKEAELAAIESSLARGRENLEAFLLEREARQREVTQRLSHHLTKRKVAEDDLAAKLEELEHLNDRLASAASLALEVASAEHQKERLESATDLLRERLRQGLEEERALSERIGELRARALQLDELEAAVRAREEELQRHETRHTDLEERCRQLAAAATLHEGTVHVLSKDLILRIDAVEEEIARFRRFDTGMDAVHELEQVRQSLLDLLVSYGIRPFGFAAGERVGPEARERMEVVAAKSDSCRDTVKVIETVRPGYVHDGPRGQTILRPAGVVTSHFC